MNSYHARALLYRKSLWQSHVMAVKEFLNSWKTEENLLLIGPSAGYSIPSEWLLKFRSVTVVEPSRLAQWILKQRLGSVAQPPWTPLFQAIDFERDQFLNGFELNRTSVLFANVLGQVKIRSQSAFNDSLKTSLQGLNWASFHDRFSANRILWNTPHGLGSAVQSTEGLIPPRRRESDLLGRRKVPLEVREHLASEALAGLTPKRVMYWDWQIAPNQVHLIEGMIHE